jgi:hypothetical protein
MSSSSDASLIASLYNALNQLNRYFIIFIFLFGLVGNMINTLVLSQGTLRSNPCAWLFLVSSVAYCIGLFSGLTSRFLSTWGADLTNTNQILCKLRNFIVFDSVTIASWLIMLATVDRWLVSNTNANRRHRGTLKNAQRGTILIVILSTMIEVQQLYCFEANLTNTPLKCYTKTVTCAILSDLTFALITMLLPLLIMFIFGLMTISNVRQAQSRLHPMPMTTNSHVGDETTTVNTVHRNQRKKIDRQMLIMLFVQVLLILLFTSPLAFHKLYLTATRNISKSVLQNNIESFILNVFILLANITYGMPFYIYTLCGGSVFRKALRSLMKTLLRKMMYRHA